MLALEGPVEGQMRVHPADFKLSLPTDSPWLRCSRAFHTRNSRRSDFPRLLLCVIVLVRHCQSLSWSHSPLHSSCPYLPALLLQTTMASLLAMFLMIDFMFMNESDFM